MGVVDLSFVLLIAGLLVGGLVLVCVSVWRLQLLLVGCGGCLVAGVGSILRAAGLMGAVFADGVDLLHGVVGSVV